MRGTAAGIRSRYVDVSGNSNCSQPAGWQQFRRTFGPGPSRAHACAAPPQPSARHFQSQRVGAPRWPQTACHQSKLDKLGGSCCGVPSRLRRASLQLPVAAASMNWCTLPRLLDAFDELPSPLCHVHQVKEFSAQLPTLHSRPKHLGSRLAIGNASPSRQRSSWGDQDHDQHKRCHSISRIIHHALVVGLRLAERL